MIWLHLVPRNPPAGVSASQLAVGETQYPAAAILFFRVSKFAKLLRELISKFAKQFRQITFAIFFREAMLRQADFVRQDGFVRQADFVRQAYFVR